ncbi:MAG: YIP1 family protein [Paracoccaceae bacterium]
MIEGLFAPRRSARRVLAAGWGLDVAVLLAVLAYALQAILAILVPGARPETAEGSLPLGAHLINLLRQLAVVGVEGFAVWGLGRLFGGTGSREGALILVAWHAFVTTLLAPFFLFGQASLREGDEEALPLLLLVALALALAQSIWVLAAYATELHGFRNPWGVVGVMVAVMMLLSTIVVSLLA